MDSGEVAKNILQMLVFLLVIFLSIRCVYFQKKVMLMMTFVLSVNTRVSVTDHVSG